MQRLPVTVLAGFLGSGKTTLVNRLLTEVTDQRFAVLVNEFGEVGIDGRLVVSSQDDLVQLANGCVCCTIRGDLSRSLAGLLDRRRGVLGRARFDRVLIEASGLASPGPIAQTLEVDPLLSERLERAGIVTLAHAARIEEQLAAFPEAAEQLAYADLVLVNHADRTDASGLALAEAAVARVTPLAPRRVVERAGVPVAELLDLQQLEARVAPPGVHGHSEGIGTQVLESARPLDVHRLKLWLQFLSNRWGTEILRIKGVLACQDQAHEVVVQAVYEWLELGPGPNPAPARSQLVLIGRGFDQAEVERGWLACLAD